MLLFMGRLNISRSVYHDFYILTTLSRCLNITVLLRWDGLVLMESALGGHRPQPHSKPPLREWTPGCLSFSRHHATVDGSLWLRVLKHISFLGNFLR